MTASPEFTQMTNEALAEIWAEIPYSFRSHMEHALYDVQASPDAWAMQATGTPSDSILLGMYEPYLSPPKTTIFESSLQRALSKFGTVRNAIGAVLRHEIYEHHFGMDHTRETLDNGFVPAYALGAQGHEIHQWEMTPSQTNVIPDSIPCIPCGQGHSQVIR